MTDTHPPLKILVAGAGIAGPAFAFWLHKLLPSTSITILERSPAPRLSGQAVDIRAAAVPIVQRMGLLEKVKEKTTTEVGVQFIAADGSVAGTFPASGDVEAQSATSEFEILRGDLASIFYDATKDLENITYVFDEMISEIVQTATPGKVEVTFANNHLPTSSYDLVVGADGQSSRTRRLLFDQDIPDSTKMHAHLRRLGQYMAYFTIPKVDSDPSYAQWYNAPKGRLIFLRPDPYGTRRAYFAVTDSNLSRFDDIDDILSRHNSIKEQKAWLEQQFQGAGWQAERVIEGMKTSDDFYMQEIVQVKLDKWSEGRVVLIGDAAHAPSPISGVGTASAIVGAYILAGELSLHPTNIPLALTQYKTLSRPFIENGQKLIPGAPQIANPQTEWGIRVFNTFMGIVSHPISRKVGGVLQKVSSFTPAFGGTDWKLPVYEGMGK
ncbi:hypothetical protein HDV00_012739 [Rhizophlyctis rosea]|nr:hypothetical protein HDV00_012739 [Rhizophlyctis rosea]